MKSNYKLNEREIWNREIILCIKHQYPELYERSYNINPMELAMRIWLFSGRIYEDIKL